MNWNETSGRTSLIPQQKEVVVEYKINWLAVLFYLLSNIIFLGLIGWFVFTYIL